MLASAPVRRVVSWQARAARCLLLGQKITWPKRPNQTPYGLCGLAAARSRSPKSRRFQNILRVTYSVRYWPCAWQPVWGLVRARASGIKIGGRRRRFPHISATATEPIPTPFVNTIMSQHLEELIQLSSCVRGLTAEDFFNILTNWNCTLVCGILECIVECTLACSNFKHLHLNCMVWSLCYHTNIGHESTAIHIQKTLGLIFHITYY